MTICGLCKYFGCEVGDFGSSSCNRYPPVYISGQPFESDSWHHPEVEAFDACGEFKKVSKAEREKRIKSAERQGYRDIAEMMRSH